MPSISTRLDTLAESVIRNTTRTANQYNAVNLAQGFPDFAPPAELLDALARVAHEPFHQYAITWGSQRFREALARKITRCAGVPIDPDQHLVVTCGGTEAMMVAMMTVCSPGDKVIIFSPYYENYYADTVLSGAEAIWVPLRPPHFGFDPEELERAFAKGAKAIILCNPGNPTGKVFTRAELMLILEMAERYDAYVITDEVYEHMVYAPNEHCYAHALPGAFDRVIVTNSLSKTYSVTGWRIGYVQASAKVIQGARKVHDYLTIGAAAPLQEAAVTALNFPDSYYDELRTFYGRQRELFLGYLRQTGLAFTEPQGAYYVMVDIGSLGFATDTEASEWFIRTVGVAGVAGSSFFREPTHNFMRFHFAKKDATLHAAGAKLATLPELRTFYGRQRELFLGYLRQTGLAFTEPQGAYYVMVDISSLGFATDTEASDWFIKTIGVAGVAGSSFFREPVHNYLRFHFAKKDETLHAAGERLVKVRNGR